MAKPKAPDLPPPILFAEVALAWEIFRAVQTQAIVAGGMGAVLIGISHQAVAMQFELRAIAHEERQDLLDLVRIAERIYVGWFNGRAGAKGGRKGSDDSSADKGRRYVRNRARRNRAR